MCIRDSFDILGRTDSSYPSLTAYAADPLVNIVIMPVSYTHLVAERCERFRYCCIVGCQNDKRRVETSGGATAVSYTHLDVYKRQVQSDSHTTSVARLAAGQVDVMVSFGDLDEAFAQRLAEILVRHGIGVLADVYKRQLLCVIKSSRTKMK